MENVMHFFEEASKRVKRLLDSLDRATGLEKKPSTKDKKPHRDNYHPIYAQEANSDGYDDHVPGTGNRFTFDSQGILRGYEPSGQDVADAVRAVADARRASREAYRAHADAERNLREVYQEHVENRKRARNAASE